MAAPRSREQIARPDGLLGGRLGPVRVTVGLAQPASPWRRLGPGRRCSAYFPPVFSSNEVSGLVDPGRHLCAVFAERVLRLVEDAHRASSLSVDNGRPRLRSPRRAHGPPLDVKALCTPRVATSARRSMDSARPAIGETDAMPVVLVGPTAVGKSSLAIALAQHYRETGPAGRGGQRGLDAGLPRDGHRHRQTDAVERATGSTT